MRKKIVFLFSSIFFGFTFLTGVNGAEVQSLTLPYSDSARSSLDDWHFLNGDAIKITVIPDTFPNGVYPIDANGYVDLPLIGPLQVTKMNKSEFVQKLVETYVPLLRFSSIQVRRVISIGFQGGFNSPGVYWVSPGATLWYALSLSGGTVREDGIKKIKLERDGIIIEEKVSELLKVSKSIAALGIRSGDVLRVLNRPKRNGWDVFRQDVLPILSFGLSTTLAAVSIYEWKKDR